MKRLMLLSAGFGLVLTAPALAQASDISQEDIVSFVQEEVGNLGKTRGICIGTAEECAPKPKREPRGLDMLVTFELDSAELTDAARENLAVFADALSDERLAAADFVVEGHTDGRGTDSYNDALSQARAASVKAYLTELGVSRERLTAIGRGESTPRTEDPLDDENRRVELRLNIE